MCSTGKKIHVSYFAVLFEDYRKKEPVEEGLSLVCRRLWDGASSSSGFCRCFCASCTLTVQRYSLTLFCIHLCLSHTTNYSDFNSTTSQLFLLTPSRWCHHVGHLFERVLIGGYLCLLQGLHMSWSSRIPSFPLYKEFFPQVLNMTPEGIYTFKWSLFSSGHLISIIFTV